MSERVETFEIMSTPQRVSLRVPTGDTRVVAGQPGKVVVRIAGSEREIARYTIAARSEEIVVEPEGGGGLLFRWSTVEITIEAGDPIDLNMRSASAGLRSTVALAALGVDTASGDVTVGDVLGALTFRSASGDLSAASVGGRVESAGASGDVDLARVEGDLRVATASGDVNVGDVLGDVSLKSASGDVSVRAFRGSAFDAKTMSGDVTVGLPRGRKFDVSLQTFSGDVRTDFPVTGESASGSPARLTVTSMSGDVHLRSVE